MKRMLFLLLVVSFLKELVWVSLVPLWQFPDEQSHVGQVAFLAITGRQPTRTENDLTEEIRKSEELLGTERDRYGNNKFTFHSEYKIEYTDSYIGKYEHEIESLRIDPSARVMVKQESSRYPAGYYAVLGFFYRMMSGQGLITRVFVLRIIQSLLFVFTVYLSWRIGSLIFEKDSFAAISIATIVSFHPMFSFVGAGVNSDNLGNMTFTLFLFASLLIIRDAITTRNVLLFFATALLCLYTKPQFIIVIPLGIALFASIIITSKMRMKQVHRWFWPQLLVGVGFFLVIPYFIGFSPYYVRAFGSFSLFPQFLLYLKSYALPHAYREVLPWYWGVYDWLGVTYPRPLHRIINWVGLLSGFCFIFWFIRAKKDKVFYSVLYLFAASIMLFLGIYYYDWLEVSQREIHLGVQGRYFFPAIVAHMSLLYIGATCISRLIFSKNGQVASTMLVILIVVLNFYALFTIAKTYYDISSFNTFVLQASQYKPFFLKSSMFILLCGLYLLFVAVFIFHFIREKRYSI